MMSNRNRTKSTTEFKKLVSILIAFQLLIIFSSVVYSEGETPPQGYEPIGSTLYKNENGYIIMYKDNDWRYIDNPATPEAYPEGMAGKPLNPGPLLNTPQEVPWYGSKNEKYTSAEFRYGDMTLVYIYDKESGTESIYEKKPGGTLECAVKPCELGQTLYSNPADKTDSELTREKILQAFDNAIAWGTAFEQLSIWLGGDKADESWLGDFQKDIAAYYSIDSFIATNLCQMPSDEDQVATSVYTSDGEIGMHLEGYKIPLDTFVDCQNNNTFCKLVFNNQAAKCYSGYCTDQNNVQLKLKKNAYKISLLISPDTRFIKKGQQVKFYVTLDGTRVDLNRDGQVNSNDQVKLLSGSSNYVKRTSIITDTSKNYNKVCMEFESTDVFTTEFSLLFDQVKSGGKNFCNSFVNEGHDTSANSPWYFIDIFGGNYGDVVSMMGFNPFGGEGFNLADKDISGQSPKTGGGGSASGGSGGGGSGASGDNRP